MVRAHKLVKINCFQLAFTHQVMFIQKIKDYFLSWFQFLKNGHDKSIFRERGVRTSNGTLSEIAKKSLRQNYTEPDLQQLPSIKNTQPPLSQFFHPPTLPRSSSVRSLITSTLLFYSGAPLKALGFLMPQVVLIK